jgi:hypothetical protein
LAAKIVTAAISDSTETGSMGHSDCTFASYAPISEVTRRRQPAFSSASPATSARG